MIATITEVKKIRSIAENIRNGRIEPYIQEVEILSVMPALGAKLYKEIEANPTAFDELLNGGYYDGDTKHFNGLLSAIAYLAYSRAVMQNSLNISPLGNVIKSGEFSTPADSKLVILASRDAEMIGNEYLSQCIEYLRFSEQIACNEKKQNTNRKFIVIKNG